jgi:spore coat protein U-like protein
LKQDGTMIAVITPTSEWRHRGVLQIACWRIGRSVTMKISSLLVRKCVIGVVAAALLIGGSAAEAASVSTTMTVTATVVPSCSVTGGTLNFNSYDPLSAAPTDGSLQIAVACTKGTTASIGLSTGSHASAGVRRMTDGIDFLSYELYQDAGRTNVWTDTGAGLLTYLASTNASQLFSVEGRIAPGQNVAAGTFSDTVTITVTF